MKLSEGELSTMGKAIDADDFWEQFLADDTFPTCDNDLGTRTPMTLSPRERSTTPIVAKQSPIVSTGICKRRRQEIDDPPMLVLDDDDDSDYVSARQSSLPVRQSMFVFYSHKSPRARRSSPARPARVRR